MRCWSAIKYGVENGVVKPISNDGSMFMIQSSKNWIEFYEVLHSHKA